MFKNSYHMLNIVEKDSLVSVANNEILIYLIDLEIKTVESQLCHLELGSNIILEYAITQQRLIALTDLKEFFEQVQKDALIPAPEIGVE